MSIDIGFLQDKAKYEAAQQVMSDLDLKYANIELMRQIEMLGDTVRRFESTAMQAKALAQVHCDNWCKGYETGKEMMATVMVHAISERLSGLMIARQKLAQALNRHSDTVADSGYGHAHIAVLHAQNFDKVLDDQLR